MPFLYLAVLALGLVPLVGSAPSPPEPLDWRRGIGESAKWAEYVAERTGEPVEILAASMRAESEGKRGSIGYCTKWVPTPAGKLICRDWTSCYKNCRRAGVWQNRLDLGVWQLRDVPFRVRGIRTVGWSWLRWYRENVDGTVPDDCPMDPECASDIMVAVVNHLKTDYKPKNCRGSRWPNSVGAWLAHYSGGPRPGVGCKARESRLHSAYVGDK